MKNKEFFYLQYDKINWPNQEKTGINSYVNDYLINNILSRKAGQSLSLFDIGFGIGFFFRMAAQKLSDKFTTHLEGCEPSEKNFHHFESKSIDQTVSLQIYNSTFLESKTSNTFDFITAIYVFPHFEFDELIPVVNKIRSLLDANGKFILVVANERYLEKKLTEKRDLFIEKNSVEFDGKTYKEVLHYTEIPEIGTIIDYNREEQFYIDLFEQNGFELESKKDLDDNGFLCTIFVFEKT